MHIAHSHGLKALRAIEQGNHKMAASHFGHALRSLRKNAPMDTATDNGDDDLEEQEAGSSPAPMSSLRQKLKGMAMRQGGC